MAGPLANTELSVADTEMEDTGVDAPLLSNKDVADLRTDKSSGGLKMAFLVMMRLLRLPDVVIGDGTLLKIANEMHLDVEDVR
jgi:hypothetical protein